MEWRHRLSNSSPRLKVGLSAVYFLLSLLAPWPLAWRLAEALVQARHVSNFEGAAGFAVVMQTPAWAGLMMLGLWIVYFFIRRSEAVLSILCLGLAVPSMALIGWGIELLR